MSVGWLIPVSNRGDCPSLPMPSAVRIALGLHPNKSIYLTDNANGTYTLSLVAPTTVTKVGHSGV
jgi:hypothetical protein